MPVSTNGNYFRTATFGGFHKQDVMDYITATNQEYQEKTAELKRLTEQAQKEHGEMAERLAVAQSEREETAAECRRLTDELARRTAALERAEQELAELRSRQEKTSARLTEAEEKLAGLEKKLPILEQDAEAYAQLKDYTATIEMEAHRKAQETVDKAESQAAHMRVKLEGWLDRVQSTYQSLRTDIAATVTHLADELDRSRAALDEVDSDFRMHDETLSALLQSEDRPTTVPFPEPLPLEDDLEKDSPEDEIPEVVPIAEGLPEDVPIAEGLPEEEPVNEEPLENMDDLKFLGSLKDLKVEDLDDLDDLEEDDV